MHIPFLMFNYTHSYTHVPQCRLRGQWRVLSPPRGLQERSHCHHCSAGWRGRGWHQREGRGAGRHTSHAFGTFIQCSTQTKVKVWLDGVVWAELMATSKLLAPPYHTYQSYVISGWRLCKADMPYVCWGEHCHFPIVYSVFSKLSYMRGTQMTLDTCVYTCICIYQGCPLFLCTFKL